MHPISPEDRREFEHVMDVWKPDSRPAAVMIRWRITEWCNYDCTYCNQEHGRFVDRGNGFTSHSFDNFPVEQWQDAFARHFGSTRLSITISGGEPFLDRKSLIPMLNFLSGLPGTECIRIDTNAAWNPQVWGELNRSKLLLNCSFHSSEIDQDQFIRNLQRILDHGFQVGMVNYVMAAEQFGDYAARRKIFAEIGVPLNANPDFRRCDYSDSEKGLLKTYLPDIDYRFKVLRVSPQGEKCLYPAIAYELDFRGRMNIACIGTETFSIFDAALAPLPEGPVPCPHTGCACLDMYSFVKGSTRNRTTNPLRDYCDQLRQMG